MRTPAHLRRSALAFVLVLGLMLQPVLATWSVVVVNTKTGEVGVASATCLANTNLIPDLPVVYPGLGAGAVQSARDPSGNRKEIIWDGFEAGLMPDEIFTLLEAVGGHNSRQYGIVGMVGSPVSWTGSGAGQGKHEVAGIVGDLRYAIQGNVLTGDEPVLAAEQALLNTQGDLGQKVMAAMEAARAMGGDGRCSCGGSPTSCGAPPPGTWKSAHTGFVILSRVGEQKGTCGTNAGCANGSYYLKKNSVGSVGSIDPIFDLQAKYDAWRLGLQGRPDHILSTVSTSTQKLVADGVSTMDVHVQLVDVEGVPLTSGGASLTLTNLSGNPDATTPGAVVDHGDGSYSFSLTAGTAAGLDDWELKFNDGVGNVRLYPRLAARVDPLTPLFSGYDTVSASAGAAVPLVVNFGAPAGAARYIIAGSTDGTQPGLIFDGGILPLNRGRFFNASVASANQAPYLGTRGNLDMNGRAEATFMPSPAMLTSLVGQRVDWAAVAFPGTPLVSAPVGFDVVP